MVLRGQSVGQPCGGFAIYECRGKKYCASHYAIASKTPRRFRLAVEASIRRLARQEMQRRAAATQLDAFIDGYDPLADIDANVPVGNVMT